MDMVHHRAMTSTEPALPDDIRFTAAGDVEVFDGESWVAIDPLVSNPQDGSRNDPGSTGRFDPARYGSTDPEAAA